MQPRQTQVIVLGHHDRRARAAQRVARRLRQRVKGLVQRDRLTQHRGDPIEAALDPGLAGALREALRVAESERREVCEGLEQVGLSRSERPLGVPRAHAEDSLDLARPAHRRDDRAAERLVGRVRHGLGQAGVVVRENRPAPCNRPAREPLVRRELEAHDALEEAVDGGAAEHPALGVEQVAVDRLGAQQLRDLVDEALQNGVQLELARHDLRRLEERALLAEAALVLLEQPRRVQCEADLARDRLRQRDVAGRP